MSSEEEKVQPKQKTMPKIAVYMKASFSPKINQKSNESPLIRKKKLMKKYQSADYSQPLQSFQNKLKETDNSQSGEYSARQIMFQTQNSVSFPKAQRFPTQVLSYTQTQQFLPRPTLSKRSTSIGLGNKYCMPQQLINRAKENPSPLDYHTEVGNLSDIRNNTKYGRTFAHSHRSYTGVFLEHNKAPHIDPIRQIRDVGTPSPGDYDLSIPIGSNKPQVTFKVRDKQFGQTFVSYSPNANYKPKLKFVQSQRYNDIQIKIGTSKRSGAIGAANDYNCGPGSYESKPSKFDKFDLSLQAKKVNNLHNLLNKKKEFALFVKEVNKKDFEQQQLSSKKQHYLF